MSTKKKSNKMSFLLVVLGLFLVIGFVAGGTYFLNNQGLLSVGGAVPGERSDRPPANFEEGTERPARPDGEEGGSGGVNAQAFAGLFKTIGQILMVVVVIAGGQWLFAWLRHRRKRAATV
jgi:hypothetical protein